MAAEVSQKAILKFAWQGASHWSQSTSVRQVELVFQNATTTVNVTIPPHFFSSKPTPS